MRRFALALLILTCAAPALAQSAIGAAEARRTFFGVDMEGVHQPSGARWRECIDPRGKTTYWFAGAIDEGRLNIRSDGALCFSYASSNFREVGCWRAKPQARGAYRFEHVNGETGAFVTTAMRRVRACPGKDVPMS
jgi:hypothetical protein